MNSETHDVRGIDASQYIQGMDEEQEMKTVKLESKEGTIFVINLEYIQLSGVITAALEDKTKESIPLSMISTYTLGWVVEYLNHHKGVQPPLVEKPLRSKQMIDVCKDEFDAEFVDRVHKQKGALVSLCNAANYLQINCLLHLCCAKIGTLLKGQPLDKLSEIVKGLKA